MYLLPIYYVARRSVLQQLCTYIIFIILFQRKKIANDGTTPVIEVKIIALGRIGKLEPLKIP